MIRCEAIGGLLDGSQWESKSPFVSVWLWRHSNMLHVVTEPNPVIEFNFTHYRLDDYDDIKQLYLYTPYRDIIETTATLTKPS